MGKRPGNNNARIKPRPRGRRSPRAPDEIERMTDVIEQFELIPHELTDKINKSGQNRYRFGTVSLIKIIKGLNEDYGWTSEYGWFDVRYSTLEEAISALKDKFGV